MTNNKVLLFLVLLLVACRSTDIIETTPTITVAPTARPTPELPNTPSAEEPIVFDFGGKSVYTQIYFDDIESSTLLPGFSLGNNSAIAITSEADQVIDGEYSLRVHANTQFNSDPDVLQLDGNTTYLFEFDYRILSRNPDKNILVHFNFRPVGENLKNSAHWISSYHMLVNADEQGSFTFGALTGDAEAYIATLTPANGTTIVIDNLRVLRQDPDWDDQQPEYWGNLDSLPFPRLGNYALGSVSAMTYGMVGEPFYYSANTIEARLALFDVIVGFEIINQTMDPGFTYRIRSLNPNIVLLPYTIAFEHGIRDPEFDDATIDYYQVYQNGLADEWFTQDSNGDKLLEWWDPTYPIYQMNLSEFSPLVEGQTFQDFQVDWVVNTILKSGNWDGIFFDNLFARVSPKLANRWDPALFDYDYNLNGVRDETLADTNQMTRQAVKVLVERVRDQVGDSEIIIGNIWAFPETAMAPFVNGYIFECVNNGWENEYIPGRSEPAWRLILDEYFYMQAESVSPVINILQGCGNHQQMEPTNQDLRSHRLTLGTALLSDGFYEYDLADNTSSPSWFDEYTVNPAGVAEEAAENKGYLGQALGDAIELSSPPVVIWEADFEIGTIPAELTVYANSGVSLSQNPDDVITGNSSLIIENPDHTQQGYIATTTDPAQLSFNPGETYVIEFDWRIIETLDGYAQALIQGDNIEMPAYQISGSVAGDHSTAIFPTTLEPGSNFFISFALTGGGKIAIDNIRVTQGGAGPWRRDFENGFVLVNPLKVPYTFTTDQLLGPFERTGIKRILGTQAPEINTGQPVNEEITLQPFDAIILLADHLPSE